jgi:hypothetical protein
MAGECQRMPAGQRQWLTRRRFGRDFSSAMESFCFNAPMQSRIAAFIMLVVLAVTPAALAGGKKENKASVTFHIETEASDNPKMIFPQLTNGQKRFYRRTPDISLKDVVSFSPFPADFGDYGIVLKLKGSASNRLAALTNMNQGRWMISQINGRVVDGVNIDKQVDDGRLVIWKGVTLEDIAVLDQELPRMGEEGKKKKKK